MSFGIVPPLQQRSSCIKETDCGVRQRHMMVSMEVSKNDAQEEEGLILDVCCMLEIDQRSDEFQLVFCRG